jgi:hypothetical protein
MTAKDLEYKKYQPLRDAVCAVYNISQEQLESSSRKSNIVSAKRMFFYFLRRHYYLQYMKIADVFNMNHATVIHHHKTMKGYLEYDKQSILDYIRVRDMVFEQNSFVTLNDELELLEREKLLLDDRVDKIKSEINYLKELENGN